MSYSAAPVQYDHELVIGDTYSGSITIYSDDAGTTPLDITGATAIARLYTVDGGELLLSPNTAVTGGTGVVAWTASAASTATLLPGDAVLGLRVTFADATVRTCLWGHVTMRRSWVG